MEKLVGTTFLLSLLLFVVRFLPVMAGAISDSIHLTYFLILSQFHLQKWHSQRSFRVPPTPFCQLQWVPLMGTRSSPQHAHKLTPPWDLAPHNKVPTTVKTRTYSQLYWGHPCARVCPEQAQPSPPQQEDMHTPHGDILGAPNSHLGDSTSGPHSNGIEDFNTPFTWIERSPWEKVTEETLALQDTIGWHTKWIYPGYYPSNEQNTHSFMCTWNIPQDVSHGRWQNILLNLRRLKLCQYFFTIMVQNQISIIRKEKIEKKKKNTWSQNICY